MKKYIVSGGIVLLCVLCVVGGLFVFGEGNSGTPSSQFYCDLGDGLTLYAIPVDSVGKLKVTLVLAENSDIYYIPEFSDTPERLAKLDTIGGLENTVLINRETGEAIRAEKKENGADTNETDTLLFSVPYADWNHYDLRFDIAPMLCLKGKIPLAVTWDESGVISLSEKFDLPDGHWLEVIGATLEKADNVNQPLNDCNRFVAVSYMLDSGTQTDGERVYPWYTDHYVNVTKSKVNKNHVSPSNGFAFGNYFAQNGEDSFTFYQPIQENERSIELSFGSFGYRKPFSGSISFMKK